MDAAIGRQSTAIRVNRQPTQGGCSLQERTPLKAMARPSGGTGRTGAADGSGPLSAACSAPAKNQPGRYSAHGDELHRLARAKREHAQVRVAQPQLVRTRTSLYRQQAAFWHPGLDHVRQVERSAHLDDQHLIAVTKTQVARRPHNTHRAAATVARRRTGCCGDRRLHQHQFAAGALPTQQSVCRLLAGLAQSQTQETRGRRRVQGLHGIYHHTLALRDGSQRRWVGRATRSQHGERGRWG